MPECLGVGYLGLQFSWNHGLGAWLEAARWAKSFTSDSENVRFYQQVEMGLEGEVFKSTGEGHWAHFQS